MKYLKLFTALLAVLTIGTYITSPPESELQVTYLLGHKLGQF